MGIIVIRDPFTGRAMTVRIAGDTPTPEEQARINQMFQRPAAPVQEPQKPSYEPGFTEKIISGVGRGAAGTIVQAPQGIGALYEMVTGNVGNTEFGNRMRGYTQAGDELVRDFFGESTGTIPETIAEATGSFSTFFIPGAGVAKGMQALGAGTRAAAIGGGAAASAFGSVLGAGEQSQRIEEARRQGKEVDDATARKSIWIGATIGLSEGLPVERILGPISKIMSKVPKEAGEEALRTIRGRLREAGKDALFEGGQEVFASIMQDLTEKGMYNPDLDIGQSAYDDFIGGAGAGGIVSFIANSLRGRQLGKFQKKQDEIKDDLERRAVEAGNQVRYGLASIEAEGEIQRDRSYSRIEPELRIAAAAKDQEIRTLDDAIKSARGEKVDELIELKRQAESERDRIYSFLTMRNIDDPVAARNEIQKAIETSGKIEKFLPAQRRKELLRRVDMATKRITREPVDEQLRQFRMRRQEREREIERAKAIATSRGVPVDQVIRENETGKIPVPTFPQVAKALPKVDGKPDVKGTLARKIREVTGEEKPWSKLKADEKRAVANSLGAKYLSQPTPDGAAMSATPAMSANKVSVDKNEKEKQLSIIDEFLPDERERRLFFEELPQVDEPTVRTGDVVEPRGVAAPQVEPQQVPQQEPQGEPQAGVQGPVGGQVSDQRQVAPQQPDSGLVEAFKSPEYRAKREEAAKALSGMLERMLPGGRGRLVAKNVILPDLLKKPNPEVVEGLEREDGPARRVIEIAMDIYEPGMSREEYEAKLRGVLGHELIHSLRALGLFSPKEWKALVKAASKTKFVEIADGKPVKRSYTFLEREIEKQAQLVATRQSDPEMIAEEAVAEMFRAHIEGRIKLPQQPRSLLGRVIAFLKSLAEGYRGGGFRTAAEIFGRIESGEIGSRTPTQARRGSVFSVNPSNTVVPLNAILYDNLSAKSPFQAGEPTNLYSPLEKAIRGAKQEAASPRDWIAIVQKMPGVKRDELDNTGILEWLRAEERRGEKRIGREDLADFVAGRTLGLSHTLMRRYYDHDTYRLGVDNGEYMEIVLYSDPVFGGMQRRTLMNVANNAAGRSNHFDVNDYVAHARVWVADNEKFGKSYIIDEVQSDAAKADLPRKKERKNVGPLPDFDTIKEFTIKSNDKYLPFENFHVARSLDSFGYREYIEGKLAHKPGMASTHSGSDWGKMVVRYLLTDAVARDADTIMLTPSGLQFHRNVSGLAGMDRLSWRSVIGGDKIITVAKNNGTDKDLLAITPDGKIHATPKKYLRGKHLSDAVGEAAASKIMASDSGELKVGEILDAPEKAYSFYENALKKEIDRIGKPHGVSMEIKSVPGVSASGENESEGAETKLWVMRLPESLKEDVMRHGLPMYSAVSARAQRSDMFHSELINQLEKVKANKAKPKDWKAIIGKLPGVKKAEADWVGLNMVLDEAGDRTLTKDEIIEIVSRRLPELQETRIGERNSEYIGYTLNRAIPGTYREILLQSPNLHKQSGDGAKPFTRRRLDAAGYAHYDHENVAGHLRVDERFDTNGNRVLFVNEIQSDMLNMLRKIRKSGGFGFEERELIKKFPWDDNLIYNLLARRMLIEAVNSKAEKLSWTPSYLQAEMWSEFKGRRINRVEVFRHNLNPERLVLRLHSKMHMTEGIGDASESVFYTKGGSIIREGGETFDAEEVLPDEIFDAIEQHLRTGEKVTVDFPNDKVVQIKGYGLQVPYDSIVRKEINKYTSKAGQSPYIDYSVYTRGNEPVPVWSVDITPEVKRMLQGKSMPMFSTVRAKPSVNDVIDRSDERINYTVALDLLSKGLKLTRLVSPERAEEISMGVVVKLQDRFAPVGKVIDKLRAKGLKIDDVTDVYRSEELYHGVVNARMDAAEKKIHEPMIQKVGDVKLSDRQWADLQKASEFARAAFESYGGRGLTAVEAVLYARHAGERNAIIRQIDPQAQSGSGMDDAEAQAIMRWYDGLPDDTRRKIDEAIKAVDLVIASINDIRIEAGLIPADIQSPFKHYVPLRGILGEPDVDGEFSMSVGMRLFGAAGREDQRMLGRQGRYAKDIIANAMAMHMAAIQRAERNRVGQSLLQLLRRHGDEIPQLRILDKPPMRRALVGSITQGGRITTVPDDYKNKPEQYIVVKENGREVIIESDDPRIAQAMNGVLIPEVYSSIIRALHKFNRFLATMSTSLNPDFLLSNMPRDIETALYNLGQYEIEGIRREALKNIKPAIVGIFNDIVRNRKNDWSEVYEDYVRHGGQNMITMMEDIEGHANKLKRILKEATSDDKGGVVYGAYKMGKEQALAAARVMEGLNTALENATRVAVYKALIDRGVSKQRAAQVARNITTNFAKGGEWKIPMNAMYLFYNASLQGSMALINATARNPKKMGKILAGMVAAGYLMDMINAALSDEDEDEEKVYDKLSDYTLEHNIIIPDPFDITERGQFSIPLGYGLHLPYNMGRSLSRLMRGGYEPKEAAASIVSSMIETVWPLGDFWNPIDGSGMKTTMAAPTVLDPFFQMAANRNFADVPIYPEQSPFGPRTAESSRHWASTNPSLVALTKWLNKVTGGTETVPGAIDLSPDKIEFWIEYFTGGVGAFLTRTASLPFMAPDLIEKGLTDDMVNNIPLFRKVYKSVSDREDTGQFAENRDRILLAEKELKDALEAGDRERAIRARKEYAAELKIAPIIRKLNSQRTKLKDLKRKIEASNMTDEQKKAMLEKIDAKIKEIVNRANKLMKEI